MIWFILVNILLLLAVAGMIMAYIRLKRLVPPDRERDNFALPVVDVLFNPALRERPEARRIQGWAIWLFCAVLALANAATLIYERLIR